MNRLKEFYCSIACVIISSLTFAQKPNLNLIFIGNSITQGAQLTDPSLYSPPAMAVAYLRKQRNIGKVNFSNQGHSGHTTLDFLPGTDAFQKVEQAAGNFTDKDSLLVFSLMLGTNDSAIDGPHGSPVSPEDFQNNLKLICDQLLKDFPKAIIIIHHPIWYSPNTNNGARYLQEGLTRLQSYFPQIDNLAKSYSGNFPGQGFVGDKKAFHYFEKHYLTDFNPEDGRKGVFYLHPNKKGARMLGEFWGKAIINCLKETAVKPGE